MATVMVTVSNPGVIANECTEECGNGDDHLRIINQPVLVKLPNLFWSRTRDSIVYTLLCWSIALVCPSVCNILKNSLFCLFWYSNL